MHNNLFNHNEDEMNHNNQHANPHMNPNMNTNMNRNPNRQRTMGEIMAPKIDQNPFNIVMPNLPNLKIGPAILNNLPMFYGKITENPYRHLTNLHLSCSTICGHHDISNVKLICFPHSLGNGPKDWLYHLQGEPITTWEQMADLFISKYFPMERTATMSSDIANIKQGRGESLHEYYDRFIRLCTECPNHGFEEGQLISQLLKGMSKPNKNMIIAAAGGALEDRTPYELRHLIGKIAISTQSFDSEEATNPLDVKALETRITNTLDTKLEEIRKAIQVPPRPCGLCFLLTHPTEQCPTLLPADETANAVYHPNPQSSGWNKYPNSGHATNPPQSFYYPPNYQPKAAFTQPQAQLPASQESEMMTMMKTMMSQVGGVKTSVDSFEHKLNQTNRHVQNLETQLKQVANEVLELKSKGGKSQLPSQGVGPSAQSCAISLRSGKELDEPRREKPTRKEKGKEKSIEDEDEIELTTPKEIREATQRIIQEKKRGYVPSVPFPSRFTMTPEDHNLELLEIFKKTQVNMPLIHAIKAMPRCAKLLKDLCAKKNRMKGNEEVKLSENVSAILTNKLPPKEKDPGMFAISCTIGDTKVENCMLDLGASINVMPYATYQKVKLGPLNETRVTIQLADGSITQPKGIVEDILVKVEDLVFPADFYVLEKDPSSSTAVTPILFGRPFMSTTHTNIDVHKGRATMEFDGKKIHFNLFDSRKEKREKACAISTSKPKVYLPPFRRNSTIPTPNTSTPLAKTQVWCGNPRVCSCFGLRGPKHDTLAEGGSKLNFSWILNKFKRGRFDAVKKEFEKLERQKHDEGPKGPTLGIE